MARSSSTLSAIPASGTTRATSSRPTPCHPPNNPSGAGAAPPPRFPRYPRLWDHSGNEFAPATLTRWTVDTGAGAVKEEQLDDRGTEFPRVDPRLVGRPYRYGYTVQTVLGMGESNAILKYDLETADPVVHDFGPGRQP